MATVKNIQAKQVKQWQQQTPETLKIIDIRTADEHAREKIPYAMCHSADAIKDMDFDKNQTVVVHCQSGNRTKQCLKQLEQANTDTIYVLEGGISAWRQVGGQTIENKKAPLPLMRQVQIIVGSMVLVGLILGYFISPWFYWLSAFFGGGLLFAGLTGFCGMANLLMLLPYNRRQK